MLAQQLFGRALQQHSPALQHDEALRCTRTIIYAAGRSDHRLACGMEPPT
ncbi:hypothetical protein QYF53_20550 [Paenibacillus polymyxa]|nr:hypothetical protein [Paenibacillus polymyxa]MDN4090279.1 hypothetical protein [Paenibacillus polymyxa]